MYKSLADCISDLEKHGYLRRIKEEVDPNMEMAAIQLRTFEAGGPALLFENIKGCRFQAAANLFGTTERGHFLFRDTWEKVNEIIRLRKEPLSAVKKPFQHLNTALAAWKAMPLKSTNSPVTFQEISIHDLPQIKHWPADGGAFITLPQVYSEDPLQPGIMHSNLGMYRIQLSGNDYVPGKEIGLHYQIHRGIGVHQKLAQQKGIPLKVSIFIGGAPSSTLAAVMPLPEGMPELTFAGLLNGRRFRYHYDSEGFMIANEADFVITGTIGDHTKPEGPFGDHFGYYSETHPFPFLKVHKVYARKNAIWPFTVVGRPPQEDTVFGNLIHELTGDAIPQEIPGIKEVHAIDEAGVHPLLFAIGSERYTPYQETQEPSELLTQANHLLGKGQLSLAKYVWIADSADNTLSTRNEALFLKYMLEHINLRRDLHFYTNTSIDTLDYSGDALNKGSKLVLAACGHKKRELMTTVPDLLTTMAHFQNLRMPFPGMLVLQTEAFCNYQKAIIEMDELAQILSLYKEMDRIPIVIVCDNSDFAARDLRNLLWTTFTKSNPAADIYGVHATTYQKHWGCDSMIIDARKKPFHAPELTEDRDVWKRTDRFFARGGSLEGIA